jgi:hypothetical protein
MLLTNYAVTMQNQTRSLGGPNNMSTITVGMPTMYMFYSGEHTIANVTDRSSFNNGYRPPYAWVLAPKEGGLGSVNNAQGVGTFTASGARGVNGTSTMAGVGSLTGTGALIVSAVATLTGSGLITNPVIIGKLSAAATLAGTGNFTASIKALGNAVSALHGTGTVASTPKALGNISASITPFTTLSPENLAAAVWNALAASYNTAGTMGSKMNDAGSGGAHPNLLNTETGDLIIPLD